MSFERDTRQTGAQAVHQVARDLTLDRQDTEVLLAELGLLEELQAGRERIAPDEAERIVQETIAR